MSEQSEVEYWANQYRHALAQVEGRKVLLQEAIQAGAEADIPETELARLAGVTRMTVRAWLGKS